MKRKKGMINASISRWAVEGWIRHLDVNGARAYAAFLAASASVTRERLRGREDEMIFVARIS
jgi:hypothetical protein